MREINFAKSFEAITAHEPYEWQKTLFARLIDDRTPQACDLPTGTGKTSVIAIWLIALALSARKDSPNLVPRRLVYVVNRRTIVDQSTDVVNELRRRLRESDSDEIRQVRRGLQSLAVSGVAADVNSLLAVSTLRGELADNGQWRLDPTRPSIVIGTVDMIGSRLLFQGYGDGRYFRSHHAGLIGSDTLIIHDESHLSPAFARLLRSIEDEQAKEPQRIGNAIRVIDLSATAIGDSDPTKTITIEADLNNALIVDRLNATKHLRRVTVTKSADETKEIVRHVKARTDKPCRVLVYVNSPKSVKEIVKELLVGDGRLESGQVMALTGTMRGFERDQFAASDVVQWFAGGPPVERAGVIVSTSAGEVGVDWDADHLVCDLTTLDAMIQRLGRVNRSGGKGRIADVIVVGNQKTKKQNGKDTPQLVGAESKPTADREGRLWETWNAIAALPSIEENNQAFDASPLALAELSGSAEACTKRPIIPALTDVLLDAWAQTSFNDPPANQLPIADWLHGRDDDAEPAETFVAWREEVKLLRRVDSTKQIERAFRVFPIRTAERLRSQTRTVLSELQILAKRLAVDASDTSQRFALVINRRSIQWMSLTDLMGESDKAKQTLIELLAFATVVLPTDAGGLSDGLLDGAAPAQVADVAEIYREGQNARLRVVVSDENEELLLPFDESRAVSSSMSSALVTKHRIALGDEEFIEEGEIARTLEFRVSRNNAETALGSTSSVMPEPLQEHVDAVVGHMQSICGKLALPSELQSALMLAAKHHDSGKSRRIWQLAAGNENFEAPIGKSGKRGFNGRALQGYRHEFGSLLDAASIMVIAQHEESELIMHLIAAHHGWARPHFDDRASDVTYPTETNEYAMIETMQRYARLQYRFGRWGLARLESLLRCADGLASAGVATRPDREATEELEVGAR